MGRQTFRVHEALARQVFTTYKSRARSQGRDFSLSIEFLIKLIGQPCHYCLSPPGNIQRRKAYPDAILFYSGIDRKDNAGPYSPENCVPCCARCNYVKGQVLSYEEMVAVGRVLKKMKNGPKG